MRVRVEGGHGVGQCGVVRGQGGGVVCICRDCATLRGAEEGGTWLVRFSIAGKACVIVGRGERGQG